MSEPEPEPVTAQFDSDEEGNLTIVDREGVTITLAPDDVNLLISGFRVREQIEAAYHQQGVTAERNRVVGVFKRHVGSNQFIMRQYRGHMKELATAVDIAYGKVLKDILGQQNNNAAGGRIITP